MIDNNITNLADSTFEQDVLQSKIPVLVDFWAPWCPPCRAMSPIVESLAAEYAGMIKFGKLNIVDQPATAMRYQVRSIPTFLLFKDGKVAEQTLGYMEKSELRRMLAPHMDQAAQLHPKGHIEHHK